MTVNRHTLLFFDASCLIAARQFFRATQIFQESEIKYIEAIFFPGADFQRDPRPA
jgi:hypothetical protein